MRNLIRSKQYLRLNIRRCSTQLAPEPLVSSPPHIPVMAKEVIQYLQPSAGETFVDMTFGAGGHTKQILKSAPNIKVFALDRDPVAYKYAKELAEEYPGQVIPLLGRFSELPTLLKEQKVLPNTIDGFLFDFGCSSMQFDVADRGFAISKNGPLDMRMDGHRCPDEPTARDVLERVSEEHLYRIIKYYGEEKMARKITRAIIETRYTFRSLKTTWELANLIDSVLADEVRTDKLGRPTSKATKVFQALRIFVNNELNEINYAMIIAHKYLKMHGRLITLSFHSLEDTVVKRHLCGNVTDFVANRSPLRFTDCGRTFTDGEVDIITDSSWKMLHQHIILPSDQEVEENPRSRSVKFRAIAKVK